ncbi:hypothetical protein D3C80_1430550 [compost metagenome]
MPRHAAASASVGFLSTVPLGQTISGRSEARIPRRSISALPSPSMAASSTMWGKALRARNPCRRESAALPAVPIRTEPAPASIRPTRRRMKARMMISPTSADPITKARKWAASKGMAVQPSDPARAPASVGRPDSWLTSPDNWPAPCVVIGASPERPSWRNTSIDPFSTSQAGAAWSPTL